LVQRDRLHRQEECERQRGAGEEQREDRRGEREQGDREDRERPDHRAAGRGPRASSAMSAASSSALAIVVPPKPTTSAKCGIAIGSSSAMLVCPIAATRITKDQQYTVA